MALTRDDLENALKQITDPKTGRDIMSAGLVRALELTDDTLRFVLEIEDRDPKTMEPVRAAAEQAARALAPQHRVMVAMTAEARPKSPPPELKPQRKAPPTPQRIGEIRHIVAIASGKGGVGKSTLAANLATALAARGRRVGLLDADVYGPSQPRMMGVSGRPGAAPDGKTIVPKVNHGVSMMSLGLMVEEDQAIAWRGPMLMGALQQMLTQVQWGPLDVLIVDLPPGTGDVQMTLAQRTQVDGAIVISTPQDVALMDARKGIDMFRKLNVPILGLVENMSTHICSNCGHEEHLFGHGGVAEEARRLGVPLLAEVPLHIDIRLAADGGTPIVLKDPGSSAAAAYRKIADEVIAAGVA